MKESKKVHRYRTKSQQSKRNNSEKNKDKPDSSQYEKYKNNIQRSLYNRGEKSPLIVCAINSIKFLYKINQLGCYLKETKYDVFHWSLQHDSLDLIQTLAELTPKRCWLPMLSHDNYHAISNYIDDILQVNLKRYSEIKSTKISILKSLMAVKYDCVLEQKIEDIIKQNKENEVTMIFMQDIKTMTKELTTVFDINPTLNPSLLTDNISPSLFTRSSSPPKKRMRISETKENKDNERQRLTKNNDDTTRPPELPSKTM